MMFGKQFTPLEKTRARLVTSYDPATRFLSAILMQMDIEYVHWCPTAAVNGKRMVINQPWFDSLTQEEQEGLMLHEAMHILLRHHLRRGERCPDKWNIAGDHVINLQLLSDGVALPPKGIHDPKYTNMSTEQVYTDLDQDDDEPEDEPDDGEDDGEGEEGEGQPGEGESNPDDGDQSPDDESGGDGEGEPGEDEADENGQPGDSGDADSDPGQGESQGEGDDGEEGEGEGNSGGQGNGDQDQPGMPSEPTGWGDVYDYPGEDGEEATEQEKAEAEHQLDQNILNAEKAAKSCGNLPGGLQRIVDEIRDPKVDWVEVMRRFVQATFAEDYSWKRPSRRHIGGGTYLPSLRSDGLMDVVLAIDTSCSMSKEELEQIAGEVNAILGDLPSKVTVLYCDTNINGEPVELESHDVPVQLEMRGGGGTNFGPVFDWVEDNADIDPACVVYFTDLECYFPDEPHYPVLWVTESEQDAPWGETVQIRY